MLTHIWGLMSPDVGRTENQKHKQYKLVLKSSELDPLLLPRLLCFRSSQSWATPIGVPSVVREWLWGPTSGCTAAQHPSHLLQLFLLGQGGWASPCFARGLQWVEGGSAAQGPVKPILPPVGLALPRGFRSSFSPGRLVEVLVWQSLKIKLFIFCLPSSSHAERVHPENQSLWEPVWLRGIT